jgi:tryptophan 2,3-dioxygenase
MFHGMTRLGMVCALTFGIAATAQAQSAQANANAQQQKEKRHPNQVPDHGIDDPAPPATTTQFDRAVEAVAVTVRADGAIVVELNDSFMEAATATVDATGSLRFDHVTGVERATGFVAGQTAAASASLPARILPLAFPVYEVK